MREGGPRIVYKLKGTFGKTLNLEEVVTMKELAISNMLELEAVRQSLFGKGIITTQDFIATFRKLDREMKGRRGKS